MNQNSNEKLIEINEQLLDHVTTINWEDRKFMTALTIFDSMLKNSGISDSSKNQAYTGVLAKTSIERAEVFINEYKTHLTQDG